MSISVVVLTSSSRNTFETYLRSLCRQTRWPDQVVVVCREGGDEPGRFIADLEKRVESRFVISVARPSGGSLSQALLLGNACATSGIVCFTSDLCTADDHWLSRIEYWFRDPRVGAVGGPVIVAVGGKPRIAYTNRWGKISWWGRRTADTGKMPRDQAYAEMLNVHNMAFRRYLLPGFDSRLRADRPHEEDRCLALIRMGFRVVVDPGIRVYYRWPGSEESGEPAADAVTSVHHDNTYVFLKRSTLPQKTVFVPYTFLLGDESCPGLIRFLLHRKGRISGSPGGHVIPAMRGKAAGLRSYLSYLRKRHAPYRS